MIDCFLSASGLAFLQGDSYRRYNCKGGTPQRRPGHPAAMRLVLATSSTVATDDTTALGGRGAAMGQSAQP